MFLGGTNAESLLYAYRLFYTSFQRGGSIERIRRYSALTKEIQY